MACEMPFENGSGELESTSTKKCPYDPPPFLIWMHSAQILKRHIHKFLPHMTVAFEKQVSELLLLLELQTPQYDKKEKGCPEQPIFNLLKQSQSHP